MKAPTLSLSMRWHLFIPASLLLVATALFKEVKQVLTTGFSAPSLSLYALIAAIVVAGLPIKRSAIPRALQILLYGSCAILIFSSAFSPTAVFDDRTSAGLPILSTTNIPSAALILGFASYFRPSLLFPTILIFAAQKHFVSAQTGIHISSTDWYIVFETALFTYIIIGISGIWSVACRFSSMLDHETTVKSIRTSFEFCVYILLAAHFGNYFYSGIGKLGLDPFSVMNTSNALQWIANNPTHDLILNAYYLGLQPFQFSKTIVLTLFDFSQHTVILMNTLVVAMQIAALGAVVSRGASRMLTALFDLQHVTIFLFTGIFFWKWIILNILFIYALSRVEYRRIDPILGTFLFATVLLSPFVFSIAHLAWFDTPAVNRIGISAVSDEGEHQVPTNFFRPASVSFAQQRVGRPLVGGYPTGTYGNFYNGHAVAELWRCESKEFHPPQLSIQALTQLSAFLKKYHNHVLNADAWTNYYYDLYPHHIFSALGTYEDFRTLDKRNIKYYNVTVESACITRTPSGISIDVRGKTSYAVHVTE